MSTPLVIAVCGKGGVGKTTVAALLAGQLAGEGRRLLAVDADHASGLTMALGLGAPGAGASTLEGVRLELAERLRAGATATRTAPRELDYLLLEALVERGSLALLTAGRPAERGCYCALNSLLREAIARLSGHFEVTLIDAEAGLEQVNREVLSGLDRLLLVADGSARSLRVAEAIAAVAAELGSGGAPALIVNRARDPGEAARVQALTTLPVLGALPEDELVRRFDAEDRPLLELPDCPARAALAALWSRIR